MAGVISFKVTVGCTVVFRWTSTGCGRWRHRRYCRGTQVPHCVLSHCGEERAVQPGTLVTGQVEARASPAGPVFPGCVNAGPSLQLVGLRRNQSLKISASYVFAAGLTGRPFCTGMSVPSVSVDRCKAPLDADTSLPTGWTEQHRLLHQVHSMSYVLVPSRFPNRDHMLVVYLQLRLHEFARSGSCL